MGLKSNGCFMTGVALMGGRYRTNIISSVDLPRSDSVVLLVLCTVVYNIQVLYYRSLEIALTLLRKGNISSKPYMRVMTYKTLDFMH